MLEMLKRTLYTGVDTDYSLVDSESGKPDFIKKANIV